MPVEYVTGAVEGLVDEAVLRRLIREAGMQCVAVYGKEGKPYLIEQLPKYNNAARYAPWCILIDLDRDAGCAPEFIDRILPDRAPGMVARVAVREVESWLLADRVNMAKFLGVRQVDIPRDPDALDDPKRQVIDLARRSRYRAIAQDLVPRPGSGRAEGPAYTSRMIEFATRLWQPREAAELSPSLARCIAAIERLRDSWRS